MAAKKNGLPTIVTTPKFRLSYPNIFEPRLNELSDKMEYSLQAIFPADADLSQLKTAVTNAANNMWGPDKRKWPAKMKSPFKSQKELIAAAEKNDRSHDQYDPNAWFMTFKTRATDKHGRPVKPPIVVGKDGRTPLEDPSLFYAGCWAKARVTAGAYDIKGANCGVTFYLNFCQFIADDEPFGGRPRIEDAFEAIPEDEEPMGVAGEDDNELDQLR